MDLTDSTDLAPAARMELERMFAALTSLEAVVRWGFSQQPPVLVEDVVVQDEFTHDVVLRWTPLRWLVVATT